MQKTLQSMLAGGLLFLLLYLVVGLGFRLSGYGEGLYDLHYVAGGWLRAGWPTPELWHPGTTVTHYYNFGLAGWGWLGSALGLPLGTTYLLGLLLLPAAVFALFFHLLAGALWVRGLGALVATFPAGGISLFVGSGLVDLPGHLRVMGHVRLTEWADRGGESWVGQHLVSGQAYPIESLAHLVLELKNLHPPVFGFVLLALALWWFCRHEDLRPAPDESLKKSLLLGGFLGLLLPLSYAINAWMLPFLLGTVLALLLLRGRPWQGLGALLGVLLGLLLLWWPFLRHFDAPNAVSLRLLRAEERSPFLSWVLIWSPQLAATAWWLLAAAWLRWRGQGLDWRSLLLPLVFLGAVLSLEIIHLDDPYGGSHERFNSVLKTGSLALAGWVGALLIVATRTRRAGIWLPVLLLLALPCALQLGDSGRKLWWERPAEPNWALQPAQMIREDDYRALYLALRQEAPGVTVEPGLEGAYNSVPLVSTLAAFPTWAGWASHLDQIGAFSSEGHALRDAIKRWYAGESPQPDPLETGAVGYVLVSYRLQWRDAEIARRSEGLGPDWAWVEVLRSQDGVLAGYFRRTEP